MFSSLNPVARHRRRCTKVRAQMSEYLDGDLDPATARAVKRHARWCPNCGRMLRSLAATLRGLQHLRDVPESAE
jgi:anti-sigma factor RsiW